LGPTSRYNQSESFHAVVRRGFEWPRKGHNKFEGYNSIVNLALVPGLFKASERPVGTTLAGGGLLGL